MLFCMTKAGQLSLYVCRSTESPYNLFTFEKRTFNFHRWFYKKRNCAQQESETDAWLWRRQDYFGQVILCNIVLYCVVLFIEYWVVFCNIVKFLIMIWYNYILSGPKQAANSRRPGLLTSRSTSLNLLLVHPSTLPRLRLLRNRLWGWWMQFYLRILNGFTHEPVSFVCWF